MSTSDGYDESKRPWGFYTVLADEPDHKVKRIHVDPHRRLSLQRHRQRAEYWTIVAGEGVVTRNDEEIPVTGGSTVVIPRGARHRIENRGDTPLVFIEVQLGTYFGEDDIERFADDYGRAPQEEGKG